MKKALPELLAPAGEAESLNAAIAAGADAVYFGGPAFNARMSAENFSIDAACEAIRRCAFYGVKSHIVLNILPYQREMKRLLNDAETLYRAGADALIVADLGVAAYIRRFFPDIQLHASTQLSAHNPEAVRELAALGFSRVVCARELPAPEIRVLCRETEAEIEMFIHGALCVSQSGQCLMSSIIGGRSGNRGECAQPCRLPYRTAKCKEAYPLSLKDLCLAGHISEILDLGIASLKIEGRMKNPSYVFGVTSLYRRLIDEGRNANCGEIEKLAALFSRNGFTDGYFLNEIDAGMQGVRSAGDFQRTKEAEQKLMPKIQQKRRLPVKLSAEFSLEKQSKLTLTHGDVSVTAEGAVPVPAQNCPLTEKSVLNNLKKFGGTPFEVVSCSCCVAPGISLPLSAINSLRRSAVDLLTSALQSARSPERKLLPTPLSGDCIPDLSENQWKNGDAKRYRLQASFLKVENVPAEALDAFDLIWLPLYDAERYETKIRAWIVSERCKIGVILPSVIFSREREETDRLLQKAAEMGICHALLGNIGHFEFVRRAGMRAHGDLRLNGYTTQSLTVWASLGLTDIVLSPELTAPQLEHIHAPIPKGVVVYGRIPLMTLERCVIREITTSGNTKPGEKRKCSACTSSVFLQDRRHAEFLLTREPEHRNILWNSVPVYMADKREILQKISTDFVRFLFTDETQEQCVQILHAYKEQRAPVGQVRRIRL